MWSGMLMLRPGVMLLTTLTKKWASTKHIHFLLGSRDACSSLRLILRKLIIPTYLIGTFGLAFPHLAVKTKPWAATKRNEENVTRWPMPGSCLRDHSCLTPALGKG